MFVLPPAAGRRVPLLRNHPQDAQSLEVTREGDGCAPGEAMQMHAHGVTSLACHVGSAVLSAEAFRSAAISNASRNATPAGP